jgi:flagellar hook-basal body complex protein FliE
MQGLNAQAYGQFPKLPGMANPGLKGHVSNDQISGNSFGDTITSMLNKANETLSKPENLSIRAVTKGDVDIHEVMIALGKSEVAFKLITAVTQKVVGAVDKLTSMQI